MPFLIFNPLKWRYSTSSRENWTLWFLIWVVWLDVPLPQSILLSDTIFISEFSGKSTVMLLPSQLSCQSGTQCRIWKLESQLNDLVDRIRKSLARDTMLMVITNAIKWDMKQWSLKQSWNGSRIGYNQKTINDGTVKKVEW